MMQKRRLELSSVLPWDVFIYLRVYSSFFCFLFFFGGGGGAFSKFKLLFVTPSFRKQLLFPKLNCFLLPLHLKIIAFFTNLIV